MARVSLLIGLLMFGCASESPASAPTDSGGADTRTTLDTGTIDTSVGDTTPSTIAANGKVTAMKGKAPLAGVEVCVYQHAEVPCATTNAAGTYFLPGIPAAVDGSLRFRKTGYLGILAPFRARTASLDDFEEMMSADDAMALATAAGASDPGSATTGTIAMNVFTGPVNTSEKRVAGATIELQPAVGKGPLYLAADGTVDPAAKATTAAGMAIFVDVPAGTHVVRITHPTLKCTDHIFIWNGDAETSGRTPVDASLMSTPTMNCPP